MRDDIGSRGEAICVWLLTQYCGRKEPFFRPHFLGEKCPTVDYLVELVQGRSSGGYFFVQVKTTTLGCNRRQRLRVSVSRAEIERLLAYPAPTYLVGIDERTTAGYVVSVNEGPAYAISSLSTRFPLAPVYLERLYQEVASYWGSRDMVLKDSHFIDEGSR